MNMLISALRVFACVSILSIPAAASAGWSIKQLMNDRNSYAGDTYAVDINDSGQILINNSRNGDSYITGSNGTGLTLLGDNMIARNINDSGQVAGWFNFIEGQYTPHIFLTGPDGVGMRDLGAFGGTYDIDVDGLNNSGQVAVRSSECFACTQHNFITGPNGVGATELSSLGKISISNINDAGQATGHFSDGSPHARQAFITGSNATGITIIDDLGGSGMTRSDTRGVDINNTGQIVGKTVGYTIDDNQLIPRVIYQNAFITGPDGVGMTNLGTLGGFYSTATAINDSGEVIGISTTASSEHTYNSFLFSHGGITNLSLLDEVVAAGWTDLNVLDINNHGQIVGSGDHGDVLDTAFLLSYTPDTIFTPNPIFIPDLLPPPPIPEPATYAMLLAGLGLIGFMARAKKQKSGEI